MWPRPNSWAGKPAGLQVSAKGFYGPLAARLRGFLSQLRTAEQLGLPCISPGPNSCARLMDLCQRVSALSPRATSYPLGRLSELTPPAGFPQVSGALAQIPGLPKHQLGCMNLTPKL